MLRERFNSGVTYKGRAFKWDTIFEQKICELGRFLTGRSLALDFTEPETNLDRQDDRELRAKIVALTASKAKQLGIGKTTLHYLRNNAGSGHSFKVSSKVRVRLLTTA